MTAVFALSAAGLIAATGTSTRTSTVAEQTVSCEDLPQLWTASHEVSYDPTTHIVVFFWADNSQSAVSDTEPGCEGQPGLEQTLREHHEGAVAVERAGCQQLRELVAAVRAERRSQGKSLQGVVEVSEAAEVTAARSYGGAQDVLAKRRAHPDRKINLDQSDSVLAQCPSSLNPPTGSSSAASTDGVCAKLRPGDPMTAYTDLQCGEQVRVETLDCSVGTYVHLSRPEGSDVEGIIGSTPVWRAAEPRSTGGRTPWAFANCQESG